MDEKRHYTYQYVYPEGFTSDDGSDLSNVVFYVGRGTGYRFNAHKAEARSGCICEKCQLIRSVWAKDQEVHIIKSDLLSAEEAVLAERKLIEKHSSVYLINVPFNRNKINANDRVMRKIKRLGEIHNYCGLGWETFLRYSGMFGITPVQYRDARVYLTSDLDKFNLWMIKTHPGVSHRRIKGTLDWE